MQINEAISILSALAQDTRMRVFRLLVRFGQDGLPAGRIADELKVNATTLSRHLAQMEAVGLVTSRRDARQMIYRPDFSVMQGLMGYLMEDCCAGEVQLPAGAGEGEGGASRACCDN
jgi:DNA-binding transcriptional ArsR family regulator